MVVHWLPALIGGPVMVVWGALFVVFRKPISRRAREQRRRWNQRVDAHTQSPLRLAIGGAILSVLGLVTAIVGVVAYTENFPG